MRRRNWLKTLLGLGAGAVLPQVVSASAGPASQAQAGQPRIGIALGAGGANGLAHISMLSVLDDLQLKPHRIAGASIGAVIGALYAAGNNAAQIRTMVESAFTGRQDNAVTRLLANGTPQWLELLELNTGEGGLLDSQHILEHFYGSLNAKDFADLDIPLQVVAADLWTTEQVVLDGGPVRAAVQASIALPGVFQPVVRDGRMLIDGGAVNPVPWDLLRADCDIVIAVDVGGQRSPPADGVPGYFETLFTSIKVMQQAIINAKRTGGEPDIFIAPQLVDIRALEFYRAEEVFRQAEPARATLRKALSEHLERWS